MPKALALPSRNAPHVQRARRKQALAVALTVIYASLLLASSASANQQSFCGRLVSPSLGYGSACTGFATAPEQQKWTYVSSRYNGAENIDEMGAVMAYAPSRTLYTFERIAFNATFVSACYFGELGTSNYPLIRQFEASGARHTLFGYADDSPNHTNCIRQQGV